MWQTIPVAGSRIDAPKVWKTLWISDTAQPSPSIATTATVSPRAGVAAGVVTGSESRARARPGSSSSSSGGRLVAVACRSGTGELLMPCGRCRQVLYEFGGPDCLLDTPRGVVSMGEVLPDAFGPDDLPQVPA